MIETVSNILPLVVLAGGLASWVSVSILNNLAAFNHGSSYIGFIMGMSALRLPNTPDTPLMKRAVHAPVWGKLALAVICMTELLVATLLWWGFATLSWDAYVGTPVESSETLLVYGFSGFMVLGFLLMVSGSWFAYYSHLPESQLTHFAIVAVGALGLNLIG